MKITAAGSVILNAVKDLRQLPRQDSSLRSEFPRVIRATINVNKPVILNAVKNLKCVLKILR